jgi:hypothetical protein
MAFRLLATQPHIRLDEGGSGMGAQRALLSSVGRCRFRVRVHSYSPDELRSLEDQTLLYLLWFLRLPIARVPFFESMCSI